MPRCVSELKKVPVVAYGSLCFYVITDTEIRKYKTPKYSK